MPGELAEQAGAKVLDQRTCDGASKTVIGSGAIAATSEATAAAARTIARQTDGSIHLELVSRTEAGPRRPWWGHP